MNDPLALLLHPLVLVFQSLIMLVMVMPVCIEEQSHCERRRHSINQEGCYQVWEQVSEKEDRGILIRLVLRVPQRVLGKKEVNT